MKKVDVCLMLAVAGVCTIPATSFADPAKVFVTRRPDLATSHTTGVSGLNGNPWQDITSLIRPIFSSDGKYIAFAAQQNLEYEGSVFPLDVVIAGRVGGPMTTRLGTGDPVLPGYIFGGATTDSLSISNTGKLSLSAGLYTPDFSGQADFLTTNAPGSGSLNILVDYHDTAPDGAAFSSLGSPQIVRSSGNHVGFFMDRPAGNTIFTTSGGASDAKIVAQANQTPIIDRRGELSFITALDRDFAVADDGSYYYLATIAGTTSAYRGRALIRSTSVGTFGNEATGTVIAQENVAFDGATLTGFESGNFAALRLNVTPGGSVMFRAAAGGEMIAIDDHVVARKAAPIFTGSSEHWTIAPTGLVTFNFAVHNDASQFVIAGYTENGDTVLVRNGLNQLLRTGDQVDLNGNGLPDDNVTFYTLNDTGSAALSDDGDLAFWAMLEDQITHMRFDAYMSLNVNLPMPVKGDFGGKATPPGQGFDGTNYVPDDVFNTSDINAFLLAAGDADTYLFLNPSLSFDDLITIGDFGGAPTPNGLGFDGTNYRPDGLFNTSDIQAFLLAASDYDTYLSLQEGAHGLSVVPEPTALSILGVSALVVMSRRRKF